MSSSGVDVSSEQLCYIPCNFCNIVLAVSVPCNNMLEIVRVRCGHCTHLWSANMATAFSEHPPHPLLQTFDYNNPTQRANNVMASSSRYHTHKTATRTAPAIDERAVVNRPPEKRQRVPSAYNQFIKEEIQRIKANNPHMTHKEAFSTAAKNWAHFPHIHFGLMLDTNNQPKLNQGHDKNLLARTALLNK